jgi:outer membrane protein OmpA-like peptidoglycan-associated protein
MEASPTTTGIAPLAGGEVSAPVVPEALAPVGMEASPTTTGIAPLAGGEVSAPVVPEALAPVGMEASPTAAVEQPTIPAPAGIIAPSASQGITEQVAQTNVAGEVSLTPPSPALAPASVSSAPKISQQPITQGSPIASVEKKHEEKIAMLTPIPSAAPEIKKIKIVHSVVITPIPLIFKNNEAVLPKDAEEGLKDVAEYMLKHKDLKLVIQGYSDAYGSEAYNKELSYYRALWVKMALERYGVPSNRLVMKPMGATKQFGHSKATYAQNRRVVLKIVK